MIETGLAGKVVIVTGGAAGIGKATARRFAREGCKVASWDVKGTEPEAGGIFQKVDVASAASVESALEETVRALGPVWALINNAGILRDGQIVKYKEGGEIMKSPSLGKEPSTLSRALTVVKVAKPNQDMRFDVPVIGLKTIATMRSEERRVGK